MIEYPKGNLVIRSRLRQLVAEKEVREGRRIFQKEIARATDLEEHTLSRWMDVRPFQKLEVRPLLELCRYLGCTLDELLLIEGEDKT